MNTKEMIKATIFPALIVATIGISIPMTGAPITLQTLFVLLAGLLLGAKLGFVSMVLYLMLGVIGVPVFAGFSSGLAVITGPTGGFLLAFPLAAYVAGYLKDKNLWLAVIAASLVIYVVGIPWMSNYLGWTILSTLSYMTIYIPGDIVKLIAAIIITKRLGSRI